MTETRDLQGPPIPVGVLGASGLTGRAMARLLHDHTRFRLAFATSRKHHQRRLDQLDPAAPPIPLQHPDDIDLDRVEAVMVCLPHGQSAPASERCLASGARVVDLSGDFRLKDPQRHQATYGSPRDPELAAAAVYGLTERCREQLPQARLVANPGCYPTCAALALLPIAEAGHLQDAGPVIINAASGVSGAGATPTDTTHFCSAYGDVRPYKLGRVHRHVAEIENTLFPRAAEQQRVIFNPHLVPLERGLLVTAVVPGLGLGEDRLRELYQQRYQDEPFVRLLPAGEATRIRAAARTNLAVLSLHPSGDDLIVSCAIDNLLKGAAGQALQNLNAMFGLPEAAGLPGVSTPQPIGAAS